MTPQLVIFDCDGVLVDSERITNQAIRDDLAQRGLEMSLAECMATFVGNTMAAVKAKSIGLGADLPPDWGALIDQKIHARLQAGTPLIEGVATVLDALDQAGVAYCVASNGGLAKMQITLGQHRAVWARLQGQIFSAESVALPKPAPDVFLQAARHFAVAPNGCTVIEDSASGALAAARAGMACMGFAPHGDGAALAAQGARLFKAMDDLPQLLKISA